MTTPLPAPGALPPVTDPAGLARSSAATSGGSISPSTAAIPPATSAGPATPATAGSTPVFPTQAALGATAISGPNAVSQLVAVMQAALANTVHVSSDGQQALRMEAFQAIVRQLAQQVQTQQAQLPSLWPAGSTAPALRELAMLLLQQITAGLPQQQQLLSVQAWPAALANAVLQQAGQSAPAGAAPPTSAGSATSPPDLPDTESHGARPQASGEAAKGLVNTPPAALTGAGAQPAATPAASVPPAAAGVVRPGIPALQNVMQQQGVIDTTEGPLRFTLTLKAPTTWVQAQPALAQALALQSGREGNAGSAFAPARHLGFATGATSTGAGTSALPARLAAATRLPGMEDGVLRVPFQGPASQLQSTTLALVMQGVTKPGQSAEALRTSALMVLDLHNHQPAPPAASSTAPLALLPAHLFPAEAVQAMINNRTDPWIQMAALQASGQEPREPRREQRSGLCTVEGCQYMGRAACAQPFCTEMNYMWATDRASRAHRS